MLKILVQAVKKGCIYYVLYLLFKKTEVCNPHEKVSAKMIKIKILLLKRIISNLEILLYQIPLLLVSNLLLDIW